MQRSGSRRSGIGAQNELVDKIFLGNFIWLSVNHIKMSTTFIHISFQSFGFSF